jgi:hypothetical protein
MADGNKVLNDAIAAAKAVLGGSWSAASSGATAQIGALVTTAQYIDANKGSMTPTEYQFLVAQQKTALQNVLTAYASIGIAAAQNAVAAVIGAVLTDIPSLVGFL